MYDNRRNHTTADSVMAKEMTHKQTDPGVVLPNIACIITNPSKFFGSLFLPFTGRAKAAVSGQYDYGFPEIGFSYQDQTSPALDDPYANLEKVQIILEGPKGDKFTKRAKTCFGAIISEEGDITSDLSAAAIDVTKKDYPTDCSDPDSDWTRVRFAILDTKTAESLDCFQGGDSSCSSVGFDNTAVTPPITAPPVPLTCSESGSSGKRVQLQYVYLEGTPNHFDSFKARLIAVAAAMDDSINAGGLASGGSRHIRFVHNGQPPCTPDIQAIALPAGSNTDPNDAKVFDALRKAGDTSPDRKYMVWADFSTASKACGRGEKLPDDQPGPANIHNGTGIAMVFSGFKDTDNGCWDSTEGGQKAAAEIHEFMHFLGGVQTSAPHVSPDGGHCLDGISTLCRGPSTDAAKPLFKSPCPTEQLDCGFDDYFSSNPPAGSYLATHWNIANSAYLTKLPATAPAPGGGGGSPVSPDGYVNPISQIKGLGQVRLTQGVDYSGTGPILALGVAHILNQRGKG